MRVVLDTNVLVSAAAYPGGIPSLILAAWKARKISVVLSPYIVEEFKSVMPRIPANRRTKAEIQDYADQLQLRSDLVEPADITDAELRDENDLAILGTLIAANADYLITGDKDLLALSHKYPVVTPAIFWNRHGW
ncbi:MAG: putative toxin-antitoxin system toxin component, PIN family [Coriobacteriia bacterium]|nr:putative toxin-antitoxin system toxin component, PIN family [Coriobacteriia bacterium]